MPYGEISEREEKIFYNALSLLLESDYKKLSRLKERFGAWSNAWKKSDKKTLRASDPEEKFRGLQKRNIALFLKDEGGYPKLLSEIYDPPFGVYVLGNLPKEEEKTISIVGTRKATTDGRSIAKNFAKFLSLRGFVITSGLALGIDAASHEGCLEAGGKTIAVLGNGLDYFYPRTNEKLAKKIIKSGGAIVSEYPLGAPPMPYRFLERNRIISGLSRGVLVIEAPEESGALVTARRALDQNRDVFVVPGPVSHPNFRGSNQLIRKGAELVTKPEEILEAFGFETDGGREEVAPTSKEEVLIWNALKNSSLPRNVDKIVELTHLETSVIARALTFMTLRGAVKETEEGYTIR